MYYPPLKKPPFDVSQLQESDISVDFEIKNF